MHSASFSEQRHNVRKADLFFLTLSPYHAHDQDEEEEDFVANHLGGLLVWDDLVGGASAPATPFKHS